MYLFFFLLLGWNGVLFVRSGFYEGAVFKFNILFPTQYPLKQVKVIFVNKIYHPLIDLKSGDLDLNFI